MPDGVDSKQLATLHSAKNILASEVDEILDWSRRLARRAVGDFDECQREVENSLEELLRSVADAEPDSPADGLHDLVHSLTDRLVQLQDSDIAQQMLLDEVLSIVRRGQESLHKLSGTTINCLSRLTGVHERFEYQLILHRMATGAARLESLREEVVRALPRSVAVVDAVLDLQSMVYSAVNDARGSATRKGVDLNVIVEKCPETLVPNAFRRVLDQLLDNAIKYTGVLPAHSRHARPWVQILATPTRAAVSIAVESWGVPMTEAEINGRIFDRRYVGVHALRMVGPSSGLGLAEVRDIVMAMSAEIRVVSAPVDEKVRAPLYEKVTFVVDIPVRGAVP